MINAVQSNTNTSATVSSNAYIYDPAGNRLAETTLTGTIGGQFAGVRDASAENHVVGRSAEDGVNS